MRLRCFLYLSRVRGTWFFILAVVVMGSKWSSSLESTRPPDGSSRLAFVGARRVFASRKKTCYVHGRRPCFLHRSHPDRLAPGGLMVEAMSKDFAVCWSHSLSGSFSDFPPWWLLERWHCFFFVKHIRKKSRCKKRICDVPDHASLLANKPFLPERF